MAPYRGGVAEADDVSEGGTAGRPAGTGSALTRGRRRRRSGRGAGLPEEILPGFAQRGGGELECGAVAVEARGSGRIWAGRAAAEARGRRGAASFGKHRVAQFLMPHPEAKLLKPFNLAHPEAELS
jgi:hypothetical protein